MDGWAAAQAQQGLGAAAQVLQGPAVVTQFLQAKPGRQGLGTARGLETERRSLRGQETVTRFWQERWQRPGRRRIGSRDSRRRRSWGRSAGGRGRMFGKSEAGVSEKVAKLVIMELGTIVGTVRGR